MRCIEYLGSQAMTPAVVFCWHLAVVEGLKQLLKQRGPKKALLVLQE